MEEFYLDSGLPGYFSGLENDDFSAYGPPSFEEVLAVSPVARAASLYESRTTDTPQPIRCVMLNRTNDSIDSTGDRKMLTQVGTIGKSRYVLFEDEWYIIASDPDNQGWYEKSVLWKCNRSISFKSRLNGEITTYPVYMTNSTKYSSGEAENKYLIVKTNQHSILLPDNEETALLGNGDRFIAGRSKGVPNVWRVTQVDDISYQFNSVGLIQLVVSADTFNEVTDDPETGVANMWTSANRDESIDTPEINDDHKVDWWG